MPPKAMYMAMETDPSLEFDCFLAQKLSKTLAELHEMCADEYMTWSMYYQRKAQRDELAMKKGGR